MEDMLILEIEVTKVTSTTGSITRETLYNSNISEKETALMEQTDAFDFTFVRTETELESGVKYFNWMFKREQLKVSYGLHRSLEEKYQEKIATFKKKR